MSNYNYLIKNTSYPGKEDDPTNALLERDIGGPLKRYRCVGDRVQRVYDHTIPRDEMIVGIHALIKWENKRANYISNMINN